MPYGVAKEQGGDSPENVAWMERCVKSIMADNPSYDKSRAIAICKAQHGKKKSRRRG